VRTFWKSTGSRSTRRSQLDERGWSYAGLARSVLEAEEAAARTDEPLTTATVRVPVPPQFEAADAATLAAVLDRPEPGVTEAPPSYAELSDVQRQVAVGRAESAAEIWASMQRQFAEGAVSVGATG